MVEESNQNTSNDQYCDLCLRMTATFDGLRGLLSRDGYTFYNRQDLLASAARGCLLCKWVMDSCTFRWSSWSNQETDPLTVQFHLAINDNVEPLEYLRENPISSVVISSPHHKGFLLPVYASEDEKAVPFVCRTVNLRGIASDWTFKKIKSWLKTCEETHSLCSPDKPSRLPRRVLDVGVNGDLGIRLYVPMKGESGKYVALSYCWGGPQSLTTTSETVKSRMEWISPTTLPQSIFDAITVTRKLGFRFLWVDSLCILQDSAEDSLQEISAMGAIYKNATVTIAAASARKVGDGFLQERAPLELLALRNSLGTFYLAKNDKQRPDRRPDGPLFSRGWAFQEFLLSPRVIIYGTKRNFSSMIQRHPDSFHHHPNPSSIWSKLVDEYSARDLTKFEDRLSAISGVVQELAALWGEEYVVGFWRSFMVNQLGWYKATTGTAYAPFLPFQHLHAQERIGSPSWSWKTAPFAVQIVWVETPAIEIIDCKVTLASPLAPFGEVTEGFLSLWAKIITVTEHKPTWEANRINLDYSATKLDSSVYLLLLGQCGRNANNVIPDIALVVRETYDGSFERIGMVYDVQCDWKGVGYRTVSLR